jgi:FkbM family methyltransferase
MRQFVCPENVKNYVDLGAYNGDTIRKLAPLAPALDRVLALEPDRRNFRKLSEYAESVRDHLHITPLQLAAWDHEETLMMDASGNRNANVSGGGKKVIPVAADALDHVIGDLAPDFIKYDVEGSEHEALIGSAETIRRNAPRLLVSLYHRSEDLFALPQLIRQLYPKSKLYLRKLRYIPAWDINLYVIPDGAKGRNENV